MNVDDFKTMKQQTCEDIHQAILTTLDLSATLPPDQPDIDVVVTLLRTAKEVIQRIGPPF